MPFCSQCGSGVSGERCSNCGTENPHFRNPAEELELAAAPAAFPPVDRERPRPWPLIESSLALAWPRMRRHPLWFAIVAAIDMLVLAYMLPLSGPLAKAPTAPAALGHFYEQLALPMLIVLAVSFAIRLLTLGDAARARLAEFRWTVRSVAALVGWLLLVFLGIAFAASVATMIVAIPMVLMMAAHAGPAAKSLAQSPAVVGALMLAVFATMIPLVAWLGTKISLLEASFVLGERSNPIGASWKLTDGYFWETLGFSILYVLVALGILIVCLGIGRLLASLSPLLALIGDFLQFAGSVWLQFAVAEGMVAWAVMLREAKGEALQG